ncbi:hypothetical protein BDF22DRAFT_742355 [Syncephalis plumigaleata]|nr:hypothetical protein BDF22DRAFT_742355 [Syncephalis plumigaleata]
MSAVRQPPSVWQEEETSALIRLQSEVWSEYESDRAIQGGRWNEVARRLALLNVSQQPRSRKQCYNKWVRMQESQTNKEASERNGNPQSEAEYPAVFRNTDTVNSELNNVMRTSRSPQISNDGNSSSNNSNHDSDEDSIMLRINSLSTPNSAPRRKGPRDGVSTPKAKQQRINDWTKDTSMLIDSRDSHSTTPPDPRNDTPTNRHRSFAPMIYTEERYAEHENINGKRPYQSVKSHRDSPSGIECRECAYGPTPKPHDSRQAYYCNGDYDHRPMNKHDHLPLSSQQQSQSQQQPLQQSQSLPLPPRSQLSVPMHQSQHHQSSPSLLSSSQGYQVLAEAFQREQELVKGLMAQQRVDMEELQRTHRDHLRDIMQLQTQFTSELKAREEAYRIEQKNREDEYRSKEQERETRWWQALDERDQRFEKLFNELLKTMNGNNDNNKQQE